MKNKYTIAGIILAVLGIGFIIFAIKNPQLSFPWPNWVTYTLYVFYAMYVVFIFCMPKIKDASPALCLILAMQFIALGCIIISIGVRSENGGQNWYLPAGISLTCIANFLNVYLKKKKNGDK